MMQKKGLEWKVGLFVVIGLTMLFIIIFSIGDIYLLIKPGYNVKVIFGFVSGLGVASPVRLAGVTVGEVKDVRVYYDEAEGSSKVEVLVWLKKEAKIRKDAEFYINTLGFLGEKYIEVSSAGSGDVGFLSKGEVVAGHDPVPIEKMTMMGQTIMAQLTESLKSINKAIGDPETIAALKETLKNSAAFTGDLKVLIADLKDHPWKLFRKPSSDRKKKKDDRRRGI